jgi:hypothetical protein
VLMTDGTIAVWGSNLDPTTSTVFPGSPELPLGQATVPTGLSNVVAISAGKGVDAVIVSLAPRISAVDFSGSNPVIRFQAFSRCTYSVEYSSDLRPGSWLPLPGGLVLGNGQDATVIDGDTADTTSTRFYRVKLLQ